jgi:hypothetical protein
VTARGHRRGFWLKRIGLATLMGVISVNIWTGGPLFALWLGSRVQGDSGLTMGTVFVVIVTLAGVLGLLAAALGALGRAYDALTGRPPRPRQRATWLRSLRDEDPHAQAHASELSALEKCLIVTVILAALALETWFFFFAGSSLPRG